MNIKKFIKKKLRVFDIDAYSLRGKTFLKIFLNTEKNLKYQSKRIKN